MTLPILTARSAQNDSSLAAGELVSALDGSDPVAVIFFAGIAHDGRAIGDALAERFPNASVIGCSTNGEFADRGYGKGGAVALALPRDRASRVAMALAQHEPGIEQSIRTAADSLEKQLGKSLRELDSTRFAAVALVDGTGREEAINAALGDASPIVPFVGGSAGDDIAMKETWVYADRTLSRFGTALLVLEMSVPFTVVKTCNYVATDRTVVVTKVDGRVVLELDGRPAAERYAELVGTTPDKLGFPDFLANPLGLVIDGQPWLRSGVRTVDGGGIYFACSMLEGAELSVMTGVELVEDTREKLVETAATLGAPIGGAVLFNCAYRMIEAQIRGSEAAYHGVLSSFAHVGAHTNGESYIGHVNQTLTGLVFA